jgi:hypothetical protein
VIKDILRVTAGRIPKKVLNRKLKGKCQRGRCQRYEQQVRKDIISIKEGIREKTNEDSYHCT